MDGQVLRRDGPSPQDAPLQGRMVDLGRGEQIAGQRAVDSLQTGQRDEHLEDPSLLSQQVPDVGDMAIDPGVVDAEAPAYDHARIGAPGKSQPGRNVVLVGRELGLDLELVTAPQRQLQIGPQAPGGFGKEVEIVLPSDPVGIAEALLINKRQPQGIGLQGGDRCVYGGCKLGLPERRQSALQQLTRSCADAVIDDDVRAVSPRRTESSLQRRFPI